MKPRFGLPETAIRQIQGVFACHAEVEEAVLYGSRATENFKNGSDIDLTLRGGEELTLRVLYKIMNELDDLLLPYSFDLSIEANVSDLEVRERIQRTGVTFYIKGKVVGFNML
jgi:uncharacterized protein